MPAENPEITQTQAALLAHILHELRPEWSIPSMMKLLWDHRTKHPYPQLVRAAINVALTPTKKTPAIIFLDGKHWLTPEQATNPAHTATTGNDPTCPDHPLEQFSTCTECAKTKTPMPADFRQRAGLKPKTTGTTP